MPPLATISKGAARANPDKPLCENWNAVHPRRAGFPAAHPAVRLVLLSSEPDTVHGATLHGTRALGNSVLRPSTANCKRKMSTQTVYPNSTENASPSFFCEKRSKNAYTNQTPGHSCPRNRSCNVQGEKVTPSFRRECGSFRRPRDAPGDRTRAQARRRGAR